MARTPHSQPGPTTATRSAPAGAEASAPRRVDRGRGFCLTERDLRLLGFVAVHRFALACQVKEWLGASEVVAYRRLRGLLENGLLSYRRIFHARPGCYQVSPTGLGVIESPLPRPTIDLRTYRHDMGVVWVWLAALNRCFGDYQRVLSEREMRSYDQRPGLGCESFAIPLGGYASGGNPRVHYADVLLSCPGGSRVAVELELTLKSRSRLEAILAGYAAERRIAGVVYFTDRPAIRSAVWETSRTVGLDGRLEVEYFERAPERDLERQWQHQMSGESEQS